MSDAPTNLDPPWITALAEVADALWQAGDKAACAKVHDARKAAAAAVADARKHALLDAGRDLSDDIWNGHGPRLRLDYPALDSIRDWLRHRAEREA